MDFVFSKKDMFPSRRTSASVFFVLLLVISFCYADVKPGQHGRNPVHNPHDGTVNDGNENSDERPASNQPVISSRAEKLVAREGESVSLPCEVKDLGSYVILWKKGIATILYAGSLQVLKEPRMKQSKDALLISDLKMSDAGEYTCQVSYSSPLEIVHTLQIQPRALYEPKTTESNKMPGGHSNHAGHGTSKTATLSSSIYLFISFLAAFLGCYLN